MKITTEHARSIQSEKQLRCQALKQLLRTRAYLDTNLPTQLEQQWNAEIVVVEEELRLIAIRLLSRTAAAKARDEELEGDAP